MGPVFGAPCRDAGSGLIRLPWQYQLKLPGGFPRLLFGQSFPPGLGDLHPDDDFFLGQQFD
jgi:hypothetical protein